jgi:hypothetical protein
MRSRKRMTQQGRRLRGSIDMKNWFAFAYSCVATGPKRTLAVCLLLCALGPALSAKAQDFNGTIITFDAPGAGTLNSAVCAPDCGTVANANNDLGVIVGYYTDANIVPHGFLRDVDGKITSFDAPGAGLGANLNQGTVAYSINDWDAIAGQFQDASYVFHGFVRYPDGAFATFDAPSAGTGAFQGTQALDINLVGTTAGYYVDGGGVQHGFVRSPEGKTEEFDPPGSILTFPCEETCLSLDGTLTGFWFDSEQTAHGFVRTPDGSIKVIDAPGAGPVGTIAASITAGGAIAGYFLDASFVRRGFLRSPSGTFTTFDAPGAGTGFAQGTAAFSLNASETVTGIYTDANNGQHGFTRFSNGSFATFDAPDSGTGSGQGTRPSTNNLEGVVTGWFIDANDLNHGFLWIP